MHLGQLCRCPLELMLYRDCDATQTTHRRIVHQLKVTDCTVVCRWCPSRRLPSVCGMPPGTSTKSLSGRCTSLALTSVRSSPTSSASILHSSVYTGPLCMPGLFTDNRLSSSGDEEEGHSFDTPMQRRAYTSILNEDGEIYQPL